MATSSKFPDGTAASGLEDEWLAVHLVDTATRRGVFLGTDADGAEVEIDEFDMYRIVDGLIVEVEGTADNAPLRH